MPRIDIPAIVAIAVREPVGGVMEQQRAAREWAMGGGALLERRPTDKVAASVVAALRNIRRKTGKYADDLNPYGATWLLTALMTDAGSRKAASERAWALLAAPLEGGGVCAVTDAETFGVAFVRLLTNETLFQHAREVWVAGDQGLAVIEFTDGSKSRFKATGSDFEPDRAIVRARSLEIARLRPVFDALAKSKRST
jgi:hypothetical protein